MKKNINAIYLALIGTLFAGFGLGYLFFPTLLIEQSGMLIPSASAKADAWAMYAGIQVGFGLFLILCANDSSLRRAGLLSIIFIFGGIAVARTLGVLYFQSYDAFNVSALCIEWPGTLVAIYLYKKNVADSAKSNI